MKKETKISKQSPKPSIKKTEKKASDLFFIKLSVNGEIFNTETKNIAQALLDLPLKVIKTRVIFEIKNPEGKICNKVLMVNKAKMIFRNKIWAHAFTKQLIFK